MNARTLLKNGWSSIIHNLPFLGRLIFIPVLILTVLHFCMNSIFGHHKDIYDVLEIFRFVLGIYFSIFIAVSWYRFLLLGDRQQEKGCIILPGFFGREFRYLLVSIFLAIIPIFIVVTMGYDVLHLVQKFTLRGFFALQSFEMHQLLESLGIGVFFLIIWGFIQIKFTLMYPSVAVDRGMHPLTSWRQTRGYWGVLLRGYLLVAFCMFIIALGLISFLSVVYLCWHFLNEHFACLRALGAFLLEDVGGLWHYIGYIIDISIEFFLQVWLIAVPAFVYKKIALD